MSDTPGKTSNPGEDLWSQMQQQYPGIDTSGIAYKYNPARKGAQGYLETYPPQEAGSPEQPRPKEFPIDKPGVEVYRTDTKPSDIAGDITSHILINSDPQVKQAYELFTKSLTPDQKDILKEQYAYAQKNEGEKRPYDQWEKQTGIPAYFRGYTFNQWPDVKNDDKWYHPEQRKLLDAVNQHLMSKSETTPAKPDIVSAQQRAPLKEQDHAGQSTPRP